MKTILIIFLFISHIAMAQNIKDIKIVFENKDLKPNGCYRIPVLAKLSDNSLMAVADERIGNCGDLRHNQDINIVIRKSFDNGKNWGEVERIVDLPLGESASDASVVIDHSTKEAYLFYNYMDLINAKDIYKQYFIKSSDNGKTWSKPTDITEQIKPKNSEKDFKFITSGKGIYTSDNRILNTLVTLQQGVFVIGSTDHGKTWKLMSSSLSPADESNLTEIDNGKIYVNSRVNHYGKRRIYTLNPDGKILEAFDDEKLIDPGCNASLLKVKRNSGDYYFFSNINNAKDRKNLGIRYSKDFGKTWSKSHTIYSGEAAYSSLEIINENKLGALFEKDDYTQIAFKVVPIKEIIKN